VTPWHSHAAFSDASEYADMGPQVVEAVSQVAPSWAPPVRRRLDAFRDWLRSRYGLRDIFLPEKYRVDSRNQVVATYSSCLALIYFADEERQLTLADIGRDPRRARLYAALREHRGIGVLLTRTPEGVHAEGRAGRALLRDGTVAVIDGENPLEPYGTEPYVLRAIEYLVQQPNAGDLVLFGAFDGYDIVSFDDQVGAHGSAGGDQVYPFLITPPALNLADETIEDARDIHRVVMMPYAAEGKGG
jgi:hypothetical protein